MAPQQSNSVVRLFLGIKNTGRGIAKYPRIKIEIHKPYSIERVKLRDKPDREFRERYLGRGSRQAWYTATIPEWLSILRLG